MIQEQDIPKKTTTVIEAPDGTTSTPLSKERAKELAEEILESPDWYKNEEEVRYILEQSK